MSGSRGVSIRDLLVKAWVVVLGAGTIGFALGFTRYFERWVWFPIWPNVGDSAFLFTTGVTVLFLGLRRHG